MPATTVLALIGVSGEFVVAGESDGEDGFCLLKDSWTN